MSLLMRGWVTKLILWNETSGQLYGQSRKDVFLTLPVCKVKLRKFESWYSGDAAEASAYGWIIFPYAWHFFFYILLRCTP